MPSTPTTKSQVQAYQFVLRRMQSALVRRDAVMLHDPMRTHSRATVVGVVLGVLSTAVYATTRHWAIVIPALAWGGGFAAALAIGAVAGLVPALRAARLSPTEALRTV